ATVGTGYTRLLREVTGNDELIGAFGLGFLSAFSIADEVTVTTTSHREPASATATAAAAASSTASSRSPPAAPPAAWSS
ncbi:molecular chaperone HtpG, partial [Streptomyces lusitanus]